MKSKKILALVAGVALALPLAACGNKAVATTNGGKITQSEYYSSMKQTTAGKQVLQQMILDKVLEKQYGSKVSSSDVNKEYNAAKKTYGSSFSSVLAQQGYTTSTFKDQIRSRLLLEEAVRASSSFSTSALKKQWKEYQPKISTAMITVGSESDAQSIIDDLNSTSSNKLKEFKKLAKSKSTDSATASSGGVMPTFDNTDTSLPDAVKTAAYKLKNGEYTTSPVQGDDDTYYVIYMIKHPAKGKYANHISDLKDQIVTENMNDSDFVKKVVSKALKKGDVSIKDSDLKNILADYLNTSSSSSSSSSSTSSSSSSDSSSTESSSASSSSAE